MQQYLQRQKKAMLTWIEIVEPVISNWEIKPLPSQLNDQLSFVSVLIIRSRINSTVI